MQTISSISNIPFLPIYLAPFGSRDQTSISLPVILCQLL